MARPVMPAGNKGPGGAQHPLWARKADTPPPPPPPPRRGADIDPDDLTVVIEPIEPSLTLGRWRIYLAHGTTRYGANDGWGWSAWTLNGARRKGARVLARRQRQLRRLSDRRLLVEDS